MQRVPKRDNRYKPGIYLPYAQKEY